MTTDYRLYVAWLLIGCAGAALLWWLAPVLTPFLIAAVIAYVLQPWVRALQTLFGLEKPSFLLVLVCEATFLLAVLGLGPAGAILYRLSSDVQRWWGSEPGAQAAGLAQSELALGAWAERAWKVIDWLPAR